MRVLLKFLLDCDPDAAWRALQSPTAFREVSLPWVDFRSDEPAGFPTVWGTGEHRVDVRAFGAFTVGTQAIRLSASEVREPLRVASGGRDSGGRDSDGRDSDGRDSDGRDSDGRDSDGRDSDGRDSGGRDSGGRDRILRDSGGGTGGLLSAIPHLDHRMAIAPDPAGPDADGRLRTLYRDQLIVKAGALTPIAWYTMWAFWQWRGIRLRQLAPTWAYDPPQADADTSADDARDDGGPEHPATEREEQP